MSNLESAVVAKLVAAGWLPAGQPPTQQQILDAVERAKAHADTRRQERAAYEALYRPKRAIRR